MGGGMSARLVQDAIEHSKAEGSARLLLVVMANVSREGLVWGLECFAKTTQLPRRTLYEARGRLIALGELRVAQQGGGRGKKTVYEIAVGPPRNSAVARKVYAPETVRKPSGNCASPVRAREPDRKNLTEEKVIPLRSGVVNGNGNGNGRDLSRFEGLMRR
jgi:hypothetical protein